jgi:hypothetical protein
MMMNVGRSSFHQRWKPLVMLAAPVLLVPLVLFFAVRPDWYYVQNGLDPFFYTGYVQSFDNIFHAAGDGHYFISRWSIYLPQRGLLTLLGDPKAAFLVMRWIGAAIVVGALSWFGANRWRRTDVIAIAVLVLLLPMSIRSLMTDYSDAVAFPLGVLVLVAIARRPDRIEVAGLVGALAALMVVANPFAATVVVTAVPFWLAMVPRRRWPVLLGAASAAGMFVLAAGWALFRWRYGIPNVYAPTLDFISEQGTVRDPLKSPRLVWLEYRLWIYLPPFVIALFHVLRRWGKVPFERDEVFVMRVCTLQYSVQVWYQFFRNGSTLEISYYWHYIVPSFVLSLAVVIGGLARRCRPTTLPIIAAVVLVLAAALPSPGPELLPSWVVGVLAATAAGVMAWRLTERLPAVVMSTIVLVVLAAQIGSPRPEPILVDELRVLSSYDSVFDDSSDGTSSFETVTWFDEQMDALPVPVQRSAVFWYDSPIGARMAAMYGAQVSGRWLLPILGTSPPTEPFPVDLVNAIAAGQIGTLVAIGAPGDLDALEAQFVAADPAMTELIRVDVPGSAGLVLGVISSLRE